MPRKTNSITQQLPSIDERQRYSIDEASRYLRLSRARLYEHINAGSIKSITDGHRRYIPGSEIVRCSSIGGGS